MKSVISCPDFSRYTTPRPTETYKAIRAGIQSPESQELLCILAYLPATHIPMAMFTGFEEAMHDFPKQVKPSFPETRLFLYVY